MTEELLTSMDRNTSLYLDQYPSASYTAWKSDLLSICSGLIETRTIVHRNSHSNTSCRT
jgi:hypothetical protein